MTGSGAYRPYAYAVPPTPQGGPPGADAGTSMTTLGLFQNQLSGGIHDNSPSKPHQRPHRVVAKASRARASTKFLLTKRYFPSAIGLSGRPGSGGSET